MAALLIRCSNTGKAVPTGFDIDPDSFESCELIDNQTHCRACGQTHTWNKADSWLAEPPILH